MLDFIRGRAVTVKPDRVTVLIGGMGFSVKIPIRVSKNIEKDCEVTLYTSLIIKEEKLEIFGFLEPYERELFLELIKISGIGSTTAMNILSNYDKETLQRIIEQQDIKALSRIPGIGKKTAQRIMLELRGVLPSIQRQKDQLYEDVLSALVNLGYKRSEAKEVLEKFYNKEKDEATLIKECLIAIAGKDSAE